MSRTAQMARIMARADADIASAVWGKPTLRQMVERAVSASAHLSALLGAGEAISDAEYCRADEAAFDTRRALLDYLASEHGIDRALAAKIGDVL